MDILYLKSNPYSYSFAIPHYEYLGDEVVLICQLLGVHKNPFEAEFTIYLYSSSTTSHELLSQFSTCSG